MPLRALKAPTFTPLKPAEITWNTWRKGLNLLLRENELDAAELTSATNLMLTGSGVPIKRWGSQDYFISAPTTSYVTRFVMPIKDENDNQQVLAYSDWGIMVKKSGASYLPLTGASWASGTDIDGAQLGGNVYLVSQNREMVRYDFTNLVGFATLASPTGVGVSNVSTATGLNTWSWRVTAVSKSGGETLASTPVSLASLPQDLTKAYFKISWNRVSAASGDLVGYSVYRGAPGDEAWIGGTEANITTFDDFGSPSTNSFRTVPTADTTGGPKAKFVIRFQDRLILAGLPGEPTKVLISGRWPDHERFDWYAGGGYVLIEPDSGQNITGLGIHQEKLVVFKENSVWQLNLNQIQIGQYYILDPQYRLMTASQGCSSHKTIVPVENDIMFANRKGVYILRYEPQLLTVINANEISAKIKPFFESLSEDDHKAANAFYADKKYVLSYPISKQSIVFDRERLCFMGPWPTPFGINRWQRFVDSTGQERWVAADSTDSKVTEFSKNYPDDKGTAIFTIFKSKKEDFGDWTTFKTINEAYLSLRNVTGNVNIYIYIEDRSGKTVVGKAVTITEATSSSTSGFGTDKIGTVLFGKTNNPATSTKRGDLPRRAMLYKTARTFQIEIRTSNNTDNYELLGIKVIAIPQARGNSPSSWNI